MSDAIYERLARAIGDVCLEWAYLETIVHDMALHLALYSDPAYERDSVRDPLHIAISHMNMTERIETVKALSHITPVDYSDRLLKHLNYIHGDVRLERNRFVHDTWEVMADGAIVRFALGPKIVRPKAHLRELVMGNSKEYGTIDEVEKFHITMVEARQTLIALENELASLFDSRPS